MPNATYFGQECPTCGRRLHIRVELLGKSVVCQHCGGRFVACDPASRAGNGSDETVLERAEQLLQTTTEGIQYSRNPGPR
jgi:hypothetical protein